MKNRRSFSYTLFDTAIGRCAVAWSDRGIVRIQLPEASDAKAFRRLAMTDDLALSEPPAAVANAIAQIRLHLEGDRQDFRDVPLDMSEVMGFYLRVYQAARRVAAGRTISYGELATRIGAPGAARAVGQALGKNPFPIVVPCHRVLAAHGRAGGFSAYGGLSTKRRILAAEGVELEQPGPPRRQPAAVEAQTAKMTGPR
ncbi:MAG TPA: methylated-DNA--[protein]-cysteine S-methyltransferase [Polyangiaceae bacterium]|nr:methylated-DNA--[protein]-cysteine S-methyltransferase [Polyangiaceae bacterium]